MQYQTPLSKFVPELQEVLKEFARKSHAANLIVEGKVIVISPSSEDKYRKAIFNDPRVPNQGLDAGSRVGAIEVQTNGDGRFYTVSSRLIRNEKYRKHSSDHYTKTSKNASKAVKAMVEHIKPFSDTEMFNFNEPHTRRLVDDWRSEHRNEGRTMWTVYSDDLYAEIRHLRDLGVQFKTEKFAQLAMNLELFEEHKARDKQPLAIFRVFVEEGRVTVSKKETDITGDPGVGSVVSTTYNSLESLPEELLSGVSMLKILGGEPRTVLRGVGYRVSDNEFYLMKPLADTTNA